MENNKNLYIFVWEFRLSTQSLHNVLIFICVFYEELYAVVAVVFLFIYSFLINN